jgi:cyclophilin family peptidyl-prolyl cis-trans isomerase/HEAT repeat protein
MRSKITIYTLLILITLTQCVPPTEKVDKDVSISMTAEAEQTVYNYIDRQLTDSLLSFTSNPDPGLRFLISNGMAAMQDPSGLDSIIALLKDRVPLVKANAAYAIGQMGMASATPYLLEAFIDKDTSNVNNIVNEKILEAIGKTGDVNLLRSLATVSTYRPIDTLLLLGQTRSIYRFALRGITLPEGTDLMTEYATDIRYPDKVRLMAAHYLQRAQNIDLDDYKFRLLETARNESNVNIKMALAAALRKSDDSELFDGLLSFFDNEKDYRVKVNIMRALASQNYFKAVEPILANLENDDLAIATTAADYLINSGSRSDASIYRNFITDSLHWEVKAKLYASILKNLPPLYARTKSIISNEIVDHFNRETNIYAKAAYLDALSYSPQNYALMKELGFDGHVILKTTAMNGLGRILRNPEFNTIFRNGFSKAKQDIMGLLKEGVQSKDSGMMAIAGGILKDKNLEFDGFEDDFSFLNDALQKVELPREIETYNELSAALARFENRKFKPREIIYNHPIDWGILNTISDTTIVNILTSKGTIKAKLFPNSAPGSVSNFLNLVKDQFYNDKVFHRVVPNFVVQTGCPRGDGYGSLNYTIRSELPAMYYDESGYMGMASAGNHTESTQWFITHSPTPHLDGKYTIFAKVIEGMDVVHSIEVGDKIQDIILTN